MEIVSHETTRSNDKHAVNKRIIAEELVSLYYPVDVASR